MKKTIILPFIFLYIFFTSCNDELCFECTNNSGSQKKNFCLPRSDAKDYKEQLESSGFDCSKFKR